MAMTPRQRMALTPPGHHENRHRNQQQPHPALAPRPALIAVGGALGLGRLSPWIQRPSATLLLLAARWLGAESTETRLTETRIGALRTSIRPEA